MRMLACTGLQGTKALASIRHQDMRTLACIGPQGTRAQASIGPQDMRTLACIGPQGTRALASKEHQDMRILASIKPQGTRIQASLAGLLQIEMILERGNIIVILALPGVTLGWAFAQPVTSIYLVTIELLQYGISHCDVTHFCLSGMSTSHYQSHLTLTKYQENTCHYHHSSPTHLHSSPTPNPASLLALLTSRQAAIPVVPPALNLRPSQAHQRTRRTCTRR